jgi:hypothetical protein
MDAVIQEATGDELVPTPTAPTALTDELVDVPEEQSGPSNPDDPLFSNPEWFDDSVRETKGPAADAVGPVTDEGKRRAHIEDLFSTVQQEPPVLTEHSPSFLSSLGWSIDDYGVIGNTSRWMAQLLDEEDPEATKQIQAHLPELMYGVPEEYEEYIVGQPSFEAAERESNRLREQDRRQQYREKEGFGQAMASGALGFVIDPVNLVPGIALFKGMTLSAKLATAAGISAGGRHVTTTASRAGIWAAAGFTEELVRQVPRLQSDATFANDQYLTEAAMAAGFAAGAPVAASAFRGAYSKVPGWATELKEAGEAMGVDQAFRQTGYAAARIADQVKEADGGLYAKFKEVDLSEAIGEARKKNYSKVQEQARELRNLDVSDQIREAVDSLDDAKTVNAIGEEFDKVAEAINARAKNDLTETIGKNRESIGAARREASLADKVEDTVADVRASARNAKKAVTEAADAAYRLLDDADLTDGARKNLKFAIDEVVDRNTQAIDKVLAKRGERPMRTGMTNKAHTEAVSGAMASMRKTATKAFQRAGDYAEGLPTGFSIGARGNHALRKAYESAGIETTASSDPGAELFTAMKGKTHKQRENIINRVSDSFKQNAQELKAQIDADPRMSPEQVNALARGIDDATLEVTNALEYAQLVARNPYTDVLAIKAKWAKVSDDWRNTGNMPELAKQYTESKAQSAIKHQFGPLTESATSRLIKSESPIAQWFGFNVLEAPAGYGGKLDRNPLTAAIYANNLDGQHTRPLLNAWETLMHETAQEKGWGMAQRLKNKKGNARTHDDVSRLSKEVQLEMNARHFGRNSTASPAVKKFVNELDASYSRLHDLQLGHVEGIHAGNKIKNYQHQKWDDDKILQLIGSRSGRDGLQALFKQGYEGAGLDAEKAEILAKAMVDQKRAAASRPPGSNPAFGEEQLAGIMPELKDVVARLRRNGTAEEIITEIVDHINKSAKGDVPGYAKSRSNIDLSAKGIIDGQPVSIVDLLDNDVPGIFVRYSKEATARRAISEATGGILNGDQAIQDMLTAMKLEALELGASVDTRIVQNALGIMMGRQYAGQLPMDVRRARDAVALAGMGGLGESQLAEFGLAINRGYAGVIGTMQKFRVAGANQNLRWRGLELTPEQASDKQFLSELQEASSLYGDMHLIQRQNVHFDALDKDYGVLSKIVDTATGGKYQPLLKHMQGKYTGYGVFRAFEDQIAMASITQDIARHFGKRKAFSSPERLRDLGVPLEEGSWLQKRFEETVTYKDNGHVEQLNLHQWSDLDRHKLGVILNRYASQQVQKGFVGEMSPEMMNPWVSFMMQFKSYPMLAAEKQQARHAKFADMEAVYGTMLNAASSAAARAIRYHSLSQQIGDDDKREKYLDNRFKNDFAHDTLAYMGGVGMLVNIHDTMANVVGDGESVASQVPVVNYVDRVIEAVKEPTARDGRNAQSAAPLGTIAQSNILLGTIRRMMEEDAEKEEE